MSGLNLLFPDDDKPTTAEWLHENGFQTGAVYSSPLPYSTGFVVHAYDDFTPQLMIIQRSIGQNVHTILPIPTRGHFRAALFLLGIQVEAQTAGAES